jgi:hypothetical protein
MQRYVDFISAKRGLAAALHSGNPAYETLPAYFRKRLRPALQTLLDAAAAAGEVRAGVEPDDLTRAVASLCAPAHAGDPTHARRMVALLVDGLRYGASVSGLTSKKRLHPRPHHSKLNAGRSMTDTRKNMPPGNKESHEDRG